MTGFARCLLFLIIGPALLSAEPIVPDKRVDLLAGELKETFSQHLNEKASLATDFEKIWRKTEEGHLHITGLGLGYLRSKAAYQNYHLVFEYQWSERSYGGRSDKARDGGALFHMQGVDGAFGGTWPACYQAQLIEGGSGDFVALPTEEFALGFTAKATNQDPPLWSPTGQELAFPLSGKKSAHLGWKDRSENWKDVKAFRGELDIENPVGEWNRLEVICDGDSVEIRLNGETVNRATGLVSPSGNVGLQTEFCEYRVRRFDLFPIGTFAEDWTPESRSSDMGYSITGESILPRRFPLSPEESLSKWEIDLPEGFEIQLVASEPLVTDPVDVVWDEEGRMFVAEMRDYPLPTETEGPLLSRIRLLSDTDGNGVMDISTTWADNLDHVQGLLPLDGGLLATTRTAILFLKDTDGDGKADVRQPLFHSNEPRHNQLQVSSPRYGLDNDVYLCNGLDGKEIYPEGSPDDVIEFPRLNLRYNPRTKGMKPSSGAGQYGGTLDAFNRHFFCSNRNPAMFAVMPLGAVQRNALAGIAQGHEDIQPAGAPVRPIALSHTTSAAHAGTYTAACGLGVYTGELLPELTGDLFVCDPTAQLVTRNKLVPKGASFSAERIGDEREFLASGDEWSRPVHVRNGPDGALYIVDMYRRFIDHARFFPEEFSKSHYMRAGFDHGRIWRIAPKGSQAKFTALPDSAKELVAELASPTGWRRTHAQRLLVERRMEEALPLLEKRLPEAGPEECAHLLGTLSGLGALTAGHLSSALEKGDAGLAEVALHLASESGRAGEIADTIGELAVSGDPRSRFLVLCLFPEMAPQPRELANIVAEAPDDTWYRNAVMSAAGDSVPEVLTNLLSNEPFLASDKPGSTETLANLARLTASMSDLEKVGRVTDLLKGEPKWWHFAVVSGLSEGLRKSSLKQKSLAALISAAPPELGDGTQTLQNLIDSATAIALDRARPITDRVTALSLVAQQSWDEKKQVVEKLIEPSESPAVQAAAVQMLSRDDRQKVAEFFFERWNILAPTPLREALTLITASPTSGLALMKRMKAGEISPSIMPPMTRWSYGRSTNEEVKALALELFGQSSENRAAVVAEYKEGIAEHAGDPAKGEIVFQKATCFTCHKVGEVGMEVGPSLNDVRIKPAEALLTDILDPNRAIEERWVSVTVETTGGRMLTGLVAADDATGITLKLPGGVSESVPRGEISKISSSGFSLMPEGLEAAMSKEEMADLIAFLKKR